MYTTIFFDLGNVVLDVFPEKMCENLGKFTGLGTETITKLFFEEKVLDLYESGQISTQELCSLFTRLANKHLSLEELRHHMTHENSAPRGKIVEIISHLKGKKIELIALSNTNEIHYEFNRDTGNFIHHFDNLILSYEVGALKPDPKIYSHALEATSSPPEKCLFIDDLEINIKGAQEAGIHGHHYTGIEPLFNHLQKVNLL